MLLDFLVEYEDEVLTITETKALQMAGVRPSSDQLKQGLPIFYQQLKRVLRLQSESSKGTADKLGDAELAQAAGLHGIELQRLGYTLSHVVHAYGSMCRSIMDLAVTKNITVTVGEFQDLNRCLDIAIAFAVTEYQTLENRQKKDREVAHLGFLAHELRNALGTVQMSLELIKDGTVGFGGSTGKVLDRGIKRMAELIDRSLTEVRLRVDPKVEIESGQLLQIVDQIVLTAGIEAKSRNQTLEIQIDPALIIEADQQLYYSALSNLIQNALKYSRVGGKIKIRGNVVKDNIVVEVEDECGGLSSNAAEELFKPFEQQHANRQGLGLGLTIAQRAMHLNQGRVEVRNLPGSGCIFKLTLPQKGKRAPSLS